MAATTLTFNDAVDEAKRHLQSRRSRLAERASMALNNSVSIRNIARRNAISTSVQLDNLAMKIKQAFPSVSLITIRLLFSQSDAEDWKFMMKLQSIIYSANDLFIYLFFLRGYDLVFTGFLVCFIRM